MTNADIDYIEAQIDSGLTALEAITSLYPTMVRRYGPDWTKWPKTSKWYVGISAIHAALEHVDALRVPVTPPVPAPPTIPVPVGAILFEDDFDGTTIDTHKWEGKGAAKPWAAPSGTIWNGLLNAWLDGNSHLVIEAVKDQATGKWYSSFLAALASNDFSYSGPRYLETRAKVPAGAGCFPAPLWEWASPWGAGPIEIDVCEQLGKEPTGYHTTVHPWLPSGDKPVGKYNEMGVVLADDFHRYGAAVYASKVDFYLDGELSAVLDMTASGLGDLTQYPVVPCIDLDMGGWGGPVDPAITQVSLLVDYVKVWRLA